MNRLEIIATFPAYIALLEAGKADVLREIFENVIEEAKKPDTAENE